MEGWLATALCLGRRGVTLPPQLWEKIQGFEDDYPDDEAWVLGPGRGCCQEGLYVVKPVGALVPGVPGEGVDHLQVLFVGLVGVKRLGAPRGASQGWPSGLWYAPATTCNQLPGFLADVVRPGWDNQREFPTRLCCEVSWLLEAEGCGGHVCHDLSQANA